LKATTTSTVSTTRNVNLTTATAVDTAIMVMKTGETGSGTVIHAITMITMPTKIVVVEITKVKISEVVRHGLNLMKLIAMARVKTI